MNFRISGNNEKNQMALVCLLFIVDGNSKQCLETDSSMLKKMDEKKTLF